jgi:anti-sigma-K factor RskA
VTPVEHDRTSTTHRDFEDMLAPAALGALESDEHARLVAHLRTCATCRATLGRLMSAVEALPVSVEVREPSTDLRERLRAQVGASAPRANAAPPDASAATDEDDDAPIPLHFVPVEETEEPVRRFPARAVWLVSAAAMLLLGLLGGVVLDRTVFRDGTSSESREIALSSPSGMELEGVRLVYDEGEGIVRFEGVSLPAPPEGKVYQAWLIEDGDTPPTPVGVIDPETGEFATAAGTGRYATFAVTVEPGPIGSAAPTSDPVIVGQLTETSPS